MRKILESLRRPLQTDRRGIALIMVMMVVSSLLIIGILFSGSVTAEYRAAVYYRQAIQSEQYCIVGLHRAMAEMMYDVWGVYEDVPFLTARYNPYPAETDALGNPGTFDATDPDTNLMKLTDCSPLLPNGSRGDGEIDAAYFCTGDGTLKPITQQRGYWNGQTWVVWAGSKVADTGDGIVDNIWNMRAEPYDRPEIEGGAQRYLSYGSGTSTGTVTVAASATGPSSVTGNGTHFDVNWIAGRQIWIDGVLYTIDAVTDETSMTIQEAHAGVADAKYYVPGSSGGDCPASADGTFPGGCQSITDFITLAKGYAANPKWVNPSKFVKYQNEEAFKYGGVDLNADGQVTADDKALRDWAVWECRRDAFLPEAIDNNDLFQNALHANNRMLWANGTPVDKGYEFLDPKIVGDSFYQIFRFDPIYTMASNISEDPSWAPGDPLDGGAAGRANQAGYRFPYDRTHLGKTDTVPWTDDICGGLVNINLCNNDYNMEQWCNAPTGSPQSCVWYHYPEAKWIYCYDPLDPDKKFGRYAASIMPDCGTWNASELHCGRGSIKSTRGALAVGSVSAVSNFVSGMREGWKPQTGDDASGNLLQSHTYSCAPMRPNPLPSYWANAGTDQSSYYYAADGGPYDTFQDGHWPPVDYTRAQEIVGGHTSHTEIRAQPWVSSGVRSMIFNYLIWLGPYDSRAELATHLRKNLYCFEPPYDKYPDNCGKTPPLRRCMAERDLSDATFAKAASDAMMFSALTTVQGYYYTLDRFWDRDLLIVDWGASPTSGDDDPRFASAQCPNNEPMAEADAADKPGQRTRRYYIQLMQDLQCYGGYRTRDGDYKLNRYLFDNDYVTYNPDPAGRVPGPIYGGGGAVQTKCTRMEKSIGMSVSRMACMQRGSNAKTAACPQGHVVHNPRISTWHKPVFAAGKLDRGQLRESAADDTVDDIAAGCPVCGGKLFLLTVHELNINEIGRFYEDFKNAENPVRSAWDVHPKDAADPLATNPGQNPLQKPMRNFVELLVVGNDCGSNHNNGTLESIVRFELLRYGKVYGDDYAFYNVPGVLGDPVTGMPYFNNPRDYDMRWRAPHTRDYAMPPEPIFKETKHSGSGSHCDYRILVYDDTEGRWHDPTHCTDWMAYGGHDKRYLYSLADPPLYNGAFKFVSDDSAASPNDWSLKDVRADEKYVMLDPDPAHQEAAGGAYTAAVSIYRKMPVRWYGGSRQLSYYLEYTWKDNYPDPLGKWALAAPQPDYRDVGRGVGFLEKTRIEYYYSHSDSKPSDFTYVGNYDVGTNPGGWPGPDSRASTSKIRRPQSLCWNQENPKQFAIITFDAAFDGTKVALVRNGWNASARPNYGSWGIVDYVELTDCAGIPIKISQACVPDTANPNTMLSWQARSPLDNRANADGYTCWDLLPMTLQNDQIDGATQGFAPTSNAQGYDPWWTDAANNKANYAYKWWGNAEDGFFAGIDIGSGQPAPPGYFDLRSGISHCRNSNLYTRNVPMRRPYYDGTRDTVLHSIEAECEAYSFRVDHCCVYGSYRAPNRKECTMSIPTGISRQVSVAEANNEAVYPALYSGRQHTVLAGMSWKEGNDTNDDRFKWAAYSYDNWADLYKLTDLCQIILWDIGSTSEDTDVFDGNQDGQLDELSTTGLGYDWTGGSVTAPTGHFCGEMKQLNKLNVNELWYPPTFSGTGYHTQKYGNQKSYTTFGRKPIKGFHAPSDCMTYNFGMDSFTNPDYNARLKPWDLDDDFSEDFYGRVPSSSSSAFNPHPDRHYQRYDAGYTTNSTVYTVFLTGNATDESDEPLAEMRARITVERTWDGRMSILEFTWLPTDRGFME